MMSIGAVFLILGVAAALALTVQSSCRSEVHCPCGRGGRDMTVCVQENSATDDPCRKWAGCKKCQDGLDKCLECPDGFEGPFCEKDALHKTKIRRKRQFYPNLRQQHHSTAPPNKRVSQMEPKESAVPQVSDRYVLYCDNPGSFNNGRAKYFPPAITTLWSNVRADIEDIPEFPQDSRLEYNCNDGYTLLGNSVLHCEPNGLWTSSPPKCAQECGRSYVQASRDIIPGSKTIAGDWPWVVAIAVQRGNAPIIICAGALLNSRTIVTAAHCLQIANSFTVYFGKYYYSDKDDDMNVKVRRSDKIIVHPDYTRETMDSDIGLITFSPPIRFTELIQPICLPTAETTTRNLRAGRRGYVTGWWLTNNSLPADKLLLSHLPVKTNDACMDSYRKQDLLLPLTPNMFCAGYANGQQSVCKGSGGAPFVFFDRQTEKFTLEGLGSFGIQGQCGLPGRYSLFTKVIRFVPWIIRNM